MALHDLNIYSKALQWPLSPNSVWHLVNVVSLFPTSHSWCFCHNNFIAVLCAFPTCFYLYFFVLAVPWPGTVFLSFSAQLTDFYSGIYLFSSHLFRNPFFFFLISLLEYKPGEGRDFFCFVHSQLRLMPWLKEQMNLLSIIYQTSRKVAWIHP